MKMTFTIETTDNGVLCSAFREDGIDLMGDTAQHLAALGALEIARASLLANRWGIDLRNGRDAAEIGKEMG